MNCQSLLSWQENDSKVESIKNLSENTHLVSGQWKSCLSHPSPYRLTRVTWLTRDRSHCWHVILSWLRWPMSQQTHELHHQIPLIKSFIMRLSLCSQFHSESPDLSQVKKKYCEHNASSIPLLFFLSTPQDYQIPSLESQHLVSNGGQIHVFNYFSHMKLH